MTSEEDKRREEENQRFLKRLIESEAETRADAPIEPKEEENVDPNATTKATPAQRTPPPLPRTRQPPQPLRQSDATGPLAMGGCIGGCTGRARRVCAPCAVRGRLGES